MNTITLIKSLLKKEHYVKYRKLVEELPEDKQQWDLLDKCHSLTENDVSVDEMYTLAEESLKPFAVRLKSLDVSDMILSEAIRIHFERVWAYRQALLLTKVVEGNLPLSDALQTYSGWEDNTVLQEDCIITDDLDVLEKEVDRKGGLRWRLDSLNEHVGGLHKGDFVVIFARPESGKTTFCTSEFGFMSGQSERPVLHFNNEERGEKVKTRYYQSVLGLTYNELFQDKRTNQQKYKEQSNLILIDKGFITKRDVEEYTKYFNPSLIIFDQIDKIKGFSADRPDLHLSKIYQWARELAKTYCPVVGICQASSSAEGKKWLTMEDMDGSKTGKPAEADLIIGVGHDPTEFEYVRGLHLIKNKITGNHAKITCLIEPQIARYKDID